MNTQAAKSSNRARDWLSDAGALLGFRRKENSSPNSSSIPKQDKAAEIVGFLRAVKLEPTPENYQFAWEYQFGASTRFRRAVDEAIEQHGHLTAAITNQLTADYLNRWNAIEISRLISGGNRVLNDGGQVIRRCHDDSKSYAEALEKELDSVKAAPVDSQCHFTALIGLTKTMALKSFESQRQLAAASESLAEMRHKLANATEQAEKDQLTGLPNRWAFEKHLDQAVNRSREMVEPLSVAFVDVDHFKLVNDNHGHESGDRVLRRIAKSLDLLSDENCHVARHGGEEFVVLFSGKNCEQAFEVIEEARTELSSHDFINQATGEKIGRISFSAGISGLSGDGDSRAMLRRADAALYKAKDEGRDRVIIAA